MDGIANVARQQQSQMNVQETQGRVQEQMQTTQQVSQTRMKQDDNIQEIQKSSTEQKTEIDSQKKVDDLIKQLNDAMEPLNPDIKFGVDQNDIFYVAAIDVKTNKMIRRFPAEQAQDFLPKMQEVSGILFDSKG